MASDKVAKRQKVSHVSDGPTSPVKTKPTATPTTTKDASPPPASSDSESPDNEHTEDAAEDAAEEAEEVTPKTFKDLVWHYWLVYIIELWLTTRPGRCRHTRRGMRHAEIRAPYQDSRGGDSRRSPRQRHRWSRRNRFRKDSCVRTAHSTSSPRKTATSLLPCPCPYT